MKVQKFNIEVSDEAEIDFDKQCCHENNIKIPKPRTDSYGRRTKVDSEHYNFKTNAKNTAEPYPFSEIRFFNEEMAFEIRLRQDSTLMSIKPAISL